MCKQCKQSEERQQWFSLKRGASSISDGIFQITLVLNNNTIHKGILATDARSKALNQHISWPHGSINWDLLAPIGNYKGNTWAPLRTASMPIGTIWKLHGPHLGTKETTCRQLRDNFVITLTHQWKNIKTSAKQIWDNFETNKTQLWHSFDKTLTQFLNYFVKTFGQHSDYLNWLLAAYSHFSRSF